MNWADLDDGSSVKAAMVAVSDSKPDDTAAVPATSPQPTVEEEEGDAELVLAKEKLKSLSVKAADPDKEVDVTEAKDVSLHGGKVSLTNTETGEETIYEVNTSFDQLGLKPELLQAVYEHGFKKPSLIQAAALPRILAGNNIIAQAHHGSGKTATFVLSMLSIVDVKLNVPQAICLCNTRELAVQILEVVQALGKHTGVRAFMAVKGVKSATNQPITHHIIVGTPGSVRNRLGREIPAPEKNIKMVVFDEADVLVNENDGYSSGGRGGGRGGARGGRGGGARGGNRSDGLVQQAAEVKRACAKAQTLLFSATFSDDVLEFAKNTAPKATMITLQKDKLALDNIVQLTMDCLDVDDKYDQLANIYENIDTKQSIIFCNTVFNTKTLCNRLREDGHNVSVIYGDMLDTEREKAVKDFREGTTKVLVSTNLLSRGLDVPAVSLVINYDVPVKPKGGNVMVPDPDTYMHRIGRSGRFGRKACSLNLTYDQASRDTVKAIEKEYSHPTMKVPRDDIDVLEQIILAAYEGKTLRPEDVKK